MAATGTTPSELIIDINNVIRSKDQPNTITPDTHSGLLDNMVKVLSADTYVNSAEYTQSASTITFTNTSGGTFDVTILPATDDVIYVSDSTGNDSTGAIGSKQTAFKTISGAVDYANASGYTGDTALIYVSSDTYTDDDIAYNGNFYFEEGAVVYSTPRNTADLKKVLFLFGTWNGVTNNTTKCSILGRGTFITDFCLDGNCWDLNPFFIQGSGVELYVEAKSIEGYTSQAFNVTGSNNKVTGHIGKIYSQFHLGGNKTFYIEGTGLEVNMTVDELIFESVSGTTFSNSQGLTITNPEDSNIILNIKKISLDVADNTGSHGIMVWEYTDLDASNSEVVVNSELLQSTSNGIYQLDVSSGKYIFNIDKIDATEDGILFLNRVNEANQNAERGFTSTFNGDIESSAGNAIHISRQSQVGARHHFNGNFISYADDTPAIIVSENDGEMYFDGIFRAFGSGSTSNAFSITAALDNNIKIRNGIAQTEGAETFTSSVANTVDILGSLSLSHEANSAVTFTGSYELSGKTHVSELNIANVGSGTSVTNLGIDASGNIVSGITGGGTFTGNTSASCISDLYVSNIYGCSPVRFHNSIILNENDSFTGETSFINGSNNVSYGGYSGASTGTSVTILSEGFESGWSGSLPSGWSSVNTSGYDAFSNLNYTQTGNCGFCPSPRTGSGAIEILAYLASGQNYFIYDGFSTINMDSATISWYGANDSSIELTFELSNDGVSWSAMTFTDVTNNGQYQLVSIDIPDTYLNQPSVKMRWGWDDIGIGDGSYAIDDLLIEGLSGVTEGNLVNGTYRNISINGNNNVLTGLELSGITMLGDGMTGNTNNSLYINKNIYFKDQLVSYYEGRNIVLTVDSEDKINLKTLDAFIISGSGTNSIVLANNLNTASGVSATALGNLNESSGDYSFTKGRSNTASGLHSSAEGGGTTASGLNSHAEGGGTTASGAQSHAEGNSTKATNSMAHAEGWRTTASALVAHSEGYETTASGSYSHAEGGDTISSGLASHAGGYGSASGKVIASGHTSFIHMRNTSSNNLGSYGDYSAIIGGLNNNINTGSTNSAIIGGSGNTINSDVVNSTILGGSNITATTSNTVFFEKLHMTNVPAYDDDADAGSSGLTTGDVYQTTGAGASPLNVAGILMIKQ